MKIGGFTAFEKNSAGKRDWASWHSPHSLTWRWIISVQKRFAMFPRFIWFARHKHNNGSQSTICLGPWAINLHTQRPMWYRDLYIRLRDERDREKYENETTAYLASQVKRAERELAQSHVH